MALGTLLSLFFCYLIWLACGNQVEEKKESLPDKEHEDLSFLPAEYTLVRDTLCNFGWTSHGFYCYRFFDTPRIFKEAEMECQSHGRHAHLVSIISKSDSDFLADLVRKAEYDVWIGLQNVQGCDTWSWTDDTTYIPSHAFWSSGQPNLCSSTDQVCGQVTLASEFHKWKDVDCFQRSGYICEIPLGSQ